MYGLVDDCASGMIKTALALRSGHMKKFRQAFKDIISSELTIWHGGDPVRLGSGPQVDGHRKFMLNTFFSTLSSDEKACIESVFNSNWETPFLEHYCHGCCENREETIAKAHKLVKFFCAASPRIFPRHKWIGSDECLDYFGRLQAVHGLLQKIIKVIFNDVGIVKVDDQDQDRQQEDNFLAMVPSIVGQSASAAPDDLKAVLKGWRQVAYRWCTSSCMMAEVLFSRLALGPQCALMAKMLAVSAGNFDKQQCAQFLRTGVRDYRILWAHENSAGQCLLEEIFEQIGFDFSEVMPWSMMSVKHSHQFYRMLARVAAATAHYVINPQKRYPYKLFGLIGKNPQVAEEEIKKDLEEHPCVLDPFSTWFLGHCHNGLRHPDAIKELEAIATMTAIDIAHTECQHASNRRLVQSKGLQVRTPNVADASSHHVARHLRVSTGIGFKSNINLFKKTNVRKIRKSHLQKKELAEKAHYKKFLSKGKALRRGGGAWNVFVSERAIRFPKTLAEKERWAQAKVEYRNLPQEEKKRLEELGYAATQARKFGAGKILSRLNKKQRKAWGLPGVGLKSQESCD